jgi:hypothetical protein
VLIVITFPVFSSSRSIEHVPRTMKDDNIEDQYLFIDEQVKYKLYEDPYFFIRDKGKP